MAKIKLTKNELKAQRDGLARFQRYLPTLQLKKQQLQMEVRMVEARIEDNKDEEKALLADMSNWRSLFSEPFDFDAHVAVDQITVSQGNIAGVSIPVLDEVSFKLIPPDLYATPAWVDDGIATLESILRLRIQQKILMEQADALREELRTTNQRVNLFEKVKIPEAKENIRVIRIFIGDQQTSEVARAKIAKGKAEAKARAS